MSILLKDMEITIRKSNKPNWLAVIASEEQSETGERLLLLI